MEAVERLVKPRLRGVFHEIGFYAAVGVGIALILTAEAGRARVSAVIFASCVAVCFGASAIYHRPTWRPRARAWLARLDHAGKIAACIAIADAERGGNGGRDEFGVGHLGQTDERDTVGKRGLKFGSHCYRQTGLSHPPWSGERQETDIAAEERGGRGDVRRASDERREQHR